MRMLHLVMQLGFVMRCGNVAPPNYMTRSVLASTWRELGSSKSTKTIIVMAECTINGVRHGPKELEVAPSEIRWKYIRGLVSR